MVLLHKGLRQCQSQPRTPITPRHQRVENAVLDRVRHTGPVVNDMQFQCQSVALFAKSHLPRNPRAENDLCVPQRDPFGQRLGRVVGDVEHGLDQLFAVAPELGDGRVVVAFDTQPAREFRQDHRAHPLTHLVDVHVPHQMRPAVRCEQAVHQRLQAVGLVDDDLGVLDQVLGLDLHLQQLRRATDATERVLDLMRQVADQLLVGLRLVDQAFFAVLFDLLLQRQQFHNNLARVFGLRHDHVHGHRLVVQAFEPGVVTQGRKLVAARPFQRRTQELGLGKTLGEGGTFNGAARGANGILQGRVGKQHGAITLHHRNQCGEQVEGLETCGVENLLFLGRLSGAQEHGPTPV